MEVKIGTCNPMVVYLLTYYFNLGNCFCTKSLINQKEFSDTAVTEPALWSKSGVESTAMCGNLCGLDRRCLSFFYNTQSGLCTAHNVQFDSSASTISDVGSLYYTRLVDEQDCDDVLRDYPHAPDGRYAIDPGHGQGHIHVYCDMPFGEGEVMMKMKDCADILLQDPNSPDGVYFVKPSADFEPFQVYCDMTQYGGGWTVFQRRKDGSVNFHQNWYSYKLGFGNLDGDFWLGNDFINKLSTQKPSQLRIDMRDKHGYSGYATYSNFRVGDETANFLLTVSGYAGDRGDSFATEHNGQQFSTYDRDNEAYIMHCAEHWGGGWWFNECFESNLNGYYGNDVYAEGINWFTWHGYDISLTWTEMKMKPA